MGTVNYFFLEKTLNIRFHTATFMFIRMGYNLNFTLLNPILLKVKLFRLSGSGNSNDDATPNFNPDSNSFILGLSNEIFFVSEFLLEGG